VPTQVHHHAYRTDVEAWQAAELRQGRQRSRCFMAMVVRRLPATRDLVSVGSGIVEFARDYRLAGSARALSVSGCGEGKKGARSSLVNQLSKRKGAGSGVSFAEHDRPVRSRPGRCGPTGGGPRSGSASTRRVDTCLTAIPNWRSRAGRHGPPVKPQRTTRTVR
jgi:hypothetical protein